MDPWYAVHVITGSEVSVAQKISKDDLFETLVPQRVLKERKEGVWKEKVRSLFPGYIFVSGEMTHQKYYKVLGIYNVIDILKGASTMPIPIGNEEMELVLKLGGEGKPLGISNLLMAENNIKVISGPLLGFEGKILKIDARRYRAKVQIILMGESREVELGINVLEKIN